MNKTTELESAGRRKAVKTIVGGVTAVAAYNFLPAKWGAPVIESVFVPAHAATSGTILNDPCSVELLQGNQTTDSVTVKVTAFVTPPTANLPVKVVGYAVGGTDQWKIVNTTTAADGTFEAFIALGGGPGITQVNAVTTVKGASGSAQCSVSTTPAPSQSNPPPDDNTTEVTVINLLGGILVFWYTDASDVEQALKIPATTTQTYTVLTNSFVRFRHNTGLPAPITSSDGSIGIGVTIANNTQESYEVTSTTSVTYTVGLN